jgi:hypothetical protein
MAMQDRLWRKDRAAWEKDQSSPAERLGARIALCMGEVTVQEGDVFGEPVNIAARVLDKVADGEVVFTDAVYLSMNRSDLLADELGPQQLRGIPYPVRTFRVKRAAVSDSPPYGTRPQPAGELLARVGSALQSAFAGHARTFGVAAAACVLLALLTLTVRRHSGGHQGNVVLDSADRELTQGHYKQARVLLAPLLAGKDVPPRALALDGRASIAAGEWKAGLERLHQAAKLDPTLRDELVNACMAGLGQGGRHRCPVRIQAITLLTSVDASESRGELARIANTNDCGRDEAKAALGAITAK